MDPNEQEIEFRIFVLRLSERLTDTETNKLVYICELPAEFKDRQPLVVLESMHNRGVFSATKLEKFARLLKEIKRDDLSRTVEKYSKTKKTRKTGAKARAGSPEADPSLTTSSQATFEVFNIQSKITRDVMDQMMKMQRLNEMGLGVRRRAMEDLECLVKSAQDLLKELDSPNSNGAQESSEDCYIYSEPRFNDEDNGDDSAAEYTYIDSDPPPAASVVQALQQRQPGAASAARQQGAASIARQPQPGKATLPAAAQLVTGLSLAGQAEKEKKPPTLPKPSKPRTEGGAATHTTNSPRVFPPSVPQKPAIDLTDLKHKKSTLRKSGSSQQQQKSSLLRASPSLSSMDSDFTGGSSADSTGGDYTGSTGDSGFGDAGQFLKVGVSRQNPKKAMLPTSKLYYKKLGTPDNLDSYMDVSRQGTAGDPQENLYEEPVEAMKRDTIYMNLEEAKTEYMNTNRPT